MSTYMEPEHIGYAVPTDLCSCEDQRLLLVQQAVRENEAWIEDGEILVDFSGDDYDDDDEDATHPALRCSACGRTWLLGVEPPKPKPAWDAACNGTGILLIDEPGDSMTEYGMTVVQRCDECATFATDEDAAKALQQIIYTSDICEKLDLFRK